MYLPIDRRRRDNDAGRGGGGGGGGEGVSVSLVATSLPIWRVLTLPKVRESARVCLPV